MKRILSLLLILVLILSVFSLGVMAAEVVTDDEIIDDELEWGYEEDYYFDEQIHFVLVVVIIVLLGIVVPIIPIISSLLKLFYKGTQHPVPYYIMFIASVIWLVLGIVVLVMIVI